MSAGQRRPQTSQAKFDELTKPVDTNPCDLSSTRRQQMAEIDRIRLQQDRAHTEQATFCPYCGKILGLGVHFCDTQ